jgi:hypothetical protein
MIGWPKPSQRKTLARETTRAKERIERVVAKQKAVMKAKGKVLSSLQRNSLANVRKSHRQRIAFSNAYTRPEVVALMAQVRKRSGGVCECCRSAPAVGYANHLGYADFTNWRRLIVPLDWLMDTCRDCHLAFHARFGHRKDLPVYRPSVPAPSHLLDFMVGL